MNKPSYSETPGGSPRTKPSTRSSIRHSLNLAGKAFADVINKDARGPDKTAKKPKSPSSRRLSAIGIKPSAPRTSMGDIKSPPQPSRRVGTPDSKTVTRRRVSAGLQRSSMDEHPPKPLDTTSATRPSSSLRPKNSGSVSTLPKLRPRSALVESSKPPSPRTGSRRRFNSDDEKEDRPMQGKVASSCSPSEKGSRPISPLPQRAALKANISAVNASPSTPTKSKLSSSTSSKISPARPTKSVKTATSVSAAQSSIPRPPSSHSSVPRPASSTSSSSSFTPHTPKTPIVKTASVVRKSTQDKRSQPSPSPHSSAHDSPLARHSRRGPQSGSSSPSPRAPGNMSHISECNSEDSETEDVEMLLAPVAALGAPTPAMPRIQSRKCLVPQTPTRANFLPSRANMSYMSPLPPDNDSSSSSLRPQQGSGKQARGSILSWEQLATEASLTLGEDEIEHMLSDIPAPFRSGAVSPSPSATALEIPESPCLSALSSPGGYGSISQVLLPDVTPSPAFHPSSQRYDKSSDLSTVDGATVTLLRLQLASVENTAKERLYQLQSMEQEIHNLKEARLREAHELATRVAYMEEQLRGNMELQRRAEEERTTYTLGLEDQLRQAQAVRDQAVEEAVVRSQESTKATQAAAFEALESQRGLSQVACLARVAASEWGAVCELSGLELDIVQGDRQVLSVLLAELDQMYQMVL